MIGGNPLEEVILDISIAAVMRHLQEVDMDFSLIIHQSMFLQVLDDLVAAGIAGQQHPPAHVERPSFVGIDGERDGHRILAIFRIAHAKLGTCRLGFVQQVFQFLLRIVRDQFLRWIGDVDDVGIAPCLALNSMR